LISNDEASEDATLRQNFYEPSRELNRLLNLLSTGEAGNKFADAISRCCAALVFLFSRRRHGPQLV